MGMFNEVNFRMKCPKCGEEVTGFQTKDGTLSLDTVEPDSVNNFYSSCDNCHEHGESTWIEFSRISTELTERKNPLSEEEVIDMGFVRKLK
jgi:hypothetical protein